MPIMLSHQKTHEIVDLFALQDYALKPQILRSGDINHFDRHAEEFLVAAELDLHAGFIVACFVEQRVRRPAEFAPSVDERPGPFSRVTSKFFLVVHGKDLPRERSADFRTPPG
jgi:hypothetical protein